MFEKPKSNQEEAEETFGAAAHERPVPRISIDVFTEFPDTNALIQKASGDRRLAKAEAQWLEAQTALDAAAE
ncbi:MAG: hypothetical protein IID54_05480 [Proteobacteria bacterium]|nr:hypothetical protein [Pseudomonadota bacterium]